ncbi:MAG TPA: hypothetical protein VIC08_04235 [Cellvibrionaceae bacterium]
MIWLILGIEVLILLSVLCIAAVLYIRKLRKLIERQQQNLRQALEQSATDPVPVLASDSDFAARDYLQANLDTTASYYQAEHSTIPLDEFDPTEASALARAVAIRHTLLTLELSKADEPWTEETWAELAAVLDPLLLGDTQQVEDLKAAILTRDKRVNNLQKFQKLFFDLEKQWEEAQSQADIYYQQLTEMTQTLDNSEAFDATLQQYHDVYHEISSQITKGVNADNPGATETAQATRIDTKTSDELAKLRNVAADQHRIIGKLQKRLREAESAEQRELVVKDLETQLQQQLRFVKESETCVELLEKELSATVVKLNALESNQNAETEETEAMRKALQQFTEESKELLRWINKLESENDALKAELSREKGSATMAASADDTALRAELDALQAEYALLEEKYLALKMKD